MERDNLIDQIRKLKESLVEVEAQLVAGEVPRAVLEDFKLAVDHTRMTVWALLSSGSGGSEEVTTATVKFRIKRVIEMCRQIVTDINAGELTIDYPEVPGLRSTLSQTLDRIERFCQCGV